MTGPSMVPMPPTSTMNSISTLYCTENTEVGSMNCVCSAISAPTAPAPAAAAR